MNLRSIRSRWERLVKSAPPVPALCWNNFAATSPDELRPDGSGIDWHAMRERTPITDPVTDLVARLPAKPGPTRNPAHPDGTKPSTTTEQEHRFPPGYRPEPETDPCS